MTTECTIEFDRVIKESKMEFERLIMESKIEFDRVIWKCNISFTLFPKSNFPNNNVINTYSRGSSRYSRGSSIKICFGDAFNV